MIYLKNKITDLTNYRTNFSEDEKNNLQECFSQIQKYIKDKYINPDFIISKVELQLHESPFTHSYLVLDNAKEEVYLSHRNYSGEEENYFCSKECNFPIWKYTMCLLVIEKWQEIKEILHDGFDEIVTVKELCANFTV